MIASQEEMEPEGEVDIEADAVKGPGLPRPRPFRICGTTPSASGPSARSFWKPMQLTILASPTRCKKIQCTRSAFVETAANVREQAIGGWHDQAATVQPLAIGGRPVRALLRAVDAYARTQGFGLYRSLAPDRFEGNLNDLRRRFFCQARP